ncbi:MAG: hypothetical protein ABIW50_03320 [Candidatus Limnocylindria bacterium]
MSEIEEKGYREMVVSQDDAQVDTWAADLFIDFAKRIGVGTAIAAFCTATGLDARGFQRAFLVGGGPDHVVGIDTAGSLAAPIFELPKAIAGLRRIDPEARQKLVGFLVEHREVMSYTA